MGGEPAKAARQHFHAVLIDEPHGAADAALLLVLLDHRAYAGDRIAHKDRLQILKRHLACQKAEHAADVRCHARRQQTRHVAVSEPTLPRKAFVEVERIVIARHTAKQSHIAFGEDAAKGECLSDVHGIEGFAHLLFEGGGRFCHYNFRKNRKCLAAVYTISLTNKRVRTLSTIAVPLDSSWHILLAKQSGLLLQ